MNSNLSSDIWVIGFPKSGNTWISYLCSYCFNLPFINFGNPNESQKRSWVKELTSGGNNWPALAGYAAVQKTHKNPDQIPFDAGLVIYAIRDPRDVFVSYHYFMKSSNAGLLGRLRYHLLGLFGKQKQIKWFLTKWEQHLNLWRDHSQLIICYDSLLAEGSEYLSELFSADPFLVDKGIVEKAYEHFSFEKMSGGRKPGSEDKHSFFRKGVSGDWQNHFTAQEAGLFDESIKLYHSTVK